MDCRTALEMLEVVRPGSTDLADVEQCEAAAHLEKCPACRSTFHDRQEWDARVGLSVRDVEVPNGLKERLLQAAASTPLGSDRPTGGRPSQTEQPAQPVARLFESSTGPTSDSVRLELPAPSVAPSSPVAAEAAPTVSQPRRRWLHTGLAAAVCLFLGLAGWYLWPTAPARLTLAELEAALTFDSARLPDFDGNFPADLPQPASTWHLLTATSAKGQVLRGEAQHSLALYFLTLEQRGRQPARGVLMVLPKSRLEAPSSQLAFSSTPIQYSPSQNLPYVLWTGDELAYVCWIEGQPHALEQLQRDLQLRVAALLNRLDAS